MSSGIKDYLGAIYGNLGMIQARMGDPTLAERYMHLAVQEGSSHRLGQVHEHTVHRAGGVPRRPQAGADTAIVVCEEGHRRAVQGTPFATLVMKPAQLLTEVYRPTDVDSAFKYSVRCTGWPTTASTTSRRSRKRS
jgi:hypothetical protein